MAKRPVLQYGGDHKKRGEDARNRVLSRVYGGGNEQQQYTRPVLQYKEPQNPLPSSFSGDSRTSMLNAPDAINNFLHPKVDNITAAQINAARPKLGEAVQTFQKKNPLYTPPAKGFIDKLGKAELKVAKTLGIPVGNGEKEFPSYYERMQQKELHSNPAEKFVGGLANTALFGIPSHLERAAYGPLANEGRDSIPYKVGEFAGYTVAPGAKTAEQLGAKLIPQTGRLANIGRNALTGAIMGGANQAAQEGVDIGFGGGIHAKDRLRSIGEATAFGGALGAGVPILGAGVKKLADKTGLSNSLRSLFRKNGIPANEIDEIFGNGQSKSDPLALPLGRRDAAIQGRPQPTNGTDPIINEYTFGLPDANPSTVNAARNADNARGELSQIDDQINHLQTTYEQRVIDEYKYLKESMGQGKTKGHVIKDPVTGEVFDKIGSISNNPKWYTEISNKSNGYKKPSNKELYELARQRVDNGFVDEQGYVPSWKEENGYDDTLSALHEVRQQLAQGIRETNPALKVTDTPLKADVLKATNKPKKMPQTETTFEESPKAPPTAQEVPQQVKQEPLKSELPKPPDHEPDVADDIVTPEPDEVSPRVRDKVNSFADEMIANARAELAKNRNRLSSNPADVYGQYAKLGAAYMLKGAVKLADFTEAMVKDFGEEIRPHVKAIFKESKDQYKALKKRIESQELGLDSLDATKLKDLTNINLDTADVYRNFKKVFGPHYDAVKKAILDPFDKSKGEFASEQKNLTDKLYNEVVKKLGIHKGSKLSALVQKYGERMMDDGYKQLYEDGKLSREMLDHFNLEKLKEQAPKDWQKIVEADKWFRTEYNRLIDRVNESVSRIYPNRPEKLVPKRADYFHHFKELSALSGVQNLFESASGKINATLSGVSPYTQPKTKFAGFKQKRGMGEFKNDAVGGFLKYIPAASYSIHIDPHIAVFRNLAKRLGADTEKTGNINNFKAFLENYANDLAGKTSDWDRWMHRAFGRKGTNFIMAANNRVKSNVILGSLRSTLAQTANIPQGIAFAKHHSVEGAIRTLDSIRRPNLAMNESDFMRERYVGKNFRRFNTKMLEQPRKFAEWMMETTDVVGTSFVWNSAYAKGKALKVANPVKYADEHTRRLVAGRGVGEVPLLQKSKTMQLFAPFQLEVGNLWRVMKDFVSEKDFIGLATLFAANFLLNKGIEKVTGSGVTFDPIEAVVESSEPGLSPLERAGRVGGEILSNLPGGQTVAAWYPENGMSMGGVKLPTRKKLFGDNDPTRFGSGLVVEKGLQDPLFKMALPFGGNQLKKTITGGESVVRGGAYKENILSAGYKLLDKNELKFKVNRNFPDTARALMFGPTATSGGQDYYNKERRPLSEKQTELYRRSSNPGQFYDRLMKTRDIDTVKRKISEIAKDKTLKPEQRKKEILKLQGDIRKITSSLSQSTR